MDFAKVEETIRADWQQNNTQEKIKQSRNNNKSWKFLDGPPFCNGQVHYGHFACFYN